MLPSVGPTRRRFTRGEYHRLAQAGIVTNTEEVELIDGAIVQWAPAGPRHAGSVAQVARQLIETLGDRAAVWRQRPVCLPGESEPRPDVILLRLDAGASFRQPARAEDVRLVVEVADVSYRYDRFIKLPLYARAGIPEVWLVDLTCEVVEVHREPGSRGYGSLRTLTPAATLTSAAFTDVAIAAADLLPPP